MARPNPIQFLQQVRQETAKVTWPGRNEVLISTVMVLVLVVAAIAVYTRGGFAVFGRNPRTDVLVLMILAIAFAALWLS